MVQRKGHLLCNQTDPSSHFHTTTPSCVTSGKLISLSEPQIFLCKAG